jgi:hypothetical protein
VKRLSASFQLESKSLLSGIWQVHGGSGGNPRRSDLGFLELHEFINSTPNSRAQLEYLNSAGDLTNI